MHDVAAASGLIIACLVPELLMCIQMEVNAV